MDGNSSLTEAKRAKKDEFYTQFQDIAAELRHYSRHFRGKTVLCNCDDPYESNFFKYFALKFNELGLRRLICTCYDGSPIAQTEMPFLPFEELSVPRRDAHVAYHLEVTEVRDENADGAVDLRDVEELLKRNPPQRLEGNGDFRSRECLALLEQADIVVTNPPFSLFREYLKTLVDYGKQFLIIGNQNAITYKEVFPLIKENKMWLGVKSGDMAFKVPEHYEAREVRYWQDASGQKWRSLGNICWFTNLDHDKRHEPLDLYKSYTPEEYPRYDNYDAINVDKTSDIPNDYKGVMGVPITFLDKYCPEQFEIVGLDRYVEDNPKYGHRFNLKGKETYARLLIRRKDEDNTKDSKDKRAC